jgi:hypothetical protein
MPSFAVWAAVVGYVVSSIVNPIFVDMMRLGGALEESSLMLTQLCMTVAMACAGCVGPRTKSDSTQRLSRTVIDRQQLFLCAFIDLVSGFCLYSALDSGIGSGVYVVIYSSCTAWTALFSYATGTSIHGAQWAGVVLVTAGLVYSGYLKMHDSNLEAGDVTAATGYVVCLVGSVLHSVYVVYANVVLRNPKTSISSLDFSSRLGQIETVVLLLLNAGKLGIYHYQAVHRSLQSWAIVFATVLALTLVWVHRVRSRQHINAEAQPQVVVDSLFVVAITFTFVAGVAVNMAGQLRLLPFLAGLTVINWVGNLTFFFVLGHSGPVFGAMLKAIQTVCVFGLSSLVFCSADPAQCATWVKARYIALLTAGLILFGVGGAYNKVKEA